MKIPQRQSLCLQTSEILRKAMSEGIWGEYLPGERELSQRLHVSRPTLRAALDILQREKLIKSAPGQRRKILHPPHAPAHQKPSSVVLISQVPLHAMSHNRIFLFDHLQRVLQENDIHFEMFNNAALGSNRPRAILNQLEKKINGRAYVLVRTSQQVQEWFQERGLPCMIIGSPFPGVHIPSIECDYPALGRHAAGVLLGRGHRSLLLVAPATNLAGDIETSEAFQQEVQRSGHLSAKCHVIRHTNNLDDLLVQFDKLRKSGKPTAAFTIYPQAAAAILTHLLAKGVRVPEEFSLLCRDNAPFFEWVTPNVAHYVLPLQHFTARFSSLVLEMADIGTLPLRRTTIMPELKVGGSLGSRVIA